MLSLGVYKLSINQPEHIKGRGLREREWENQYRASPRIVKEKKKTSSSIIHSNGVQERTYAEQDDAMQIDQESEILLVCSWSCERNRP